MIGASAAPVHRSAPGNAMKADYEFGQDNMSLLKFVWVAVAPA